MAEDNKQINSLTQKFATGSPVGSGVGENQSQFQGSGDDLVRAGVGVAGRGDSGDDNPESVGRVNSFSQKDNVGTGDRVVSLKNMMTDKELAKMKQLEEEKKRALKLKKTNTGDKNIKGGLSVKEKSRLKITPKGKVIKEALTTGISSDQLGLTSGEMGDKNTISLENEVEKKVSGGLERVMGERNVVNLKNQKRASVGVELGMREERSLPDNFENNKDVAWEKQRVDLSNLTPEKRLEIQASPYLASAHWKMDDDLNGDVKNLFEQYNRLPLEIKLGLGSVRVRQEVEKVARDFELFKEEYLGEISRIVRDYFLAGWKKDELIKRVKKVFAFDTSRAESLISHILRIVKLVEEEGKKMARQFYVSLTLEEAEARYPNLGEQKITKEDIFNEKTGVFIEPTIDNWVMNYINYAGSGAHSALERSRYLSNSANVAKLSPEERECLKKILRSFDEKTKLVFTKDDGILMCGLDDVSSVLTIGKEEDFLKKKTGKRVLNNFRIDEAQVVDVDREINDI